MAGLEFNDGAQIEIVLKVDYESLRTRGLRHFEKKLISTASRPHFFDQRL